MSQYTNPLSKQPTIARSITDNDKVSIAVRGQSQKSEDRPKSAMYWFTLIVVLGVFLFLIPLLELAVGGKYLNTTTCTSHGINGTQTLFVKGFFGILYLLSFMIYWCKKPVDFRQTFWKVIKSFHIIFLVITLAHATTHFILMVLEFVIVNQCTDLVKNVYGMLVVSALNTLFALLYVIYTVLRAILC